MLPVRLRPEWWQDPSVNAIGATAFRAGAELFDRHRFWQIARRLIDVAALLQGDGVSEQLRRDVEQDRVELAL